MAADGPTRHLGIDLGATNVKWVVLERAGEAWSTLDRGQVPTLAAEGPDAVVARLAAVGRSAMERWPGIISGGIGVPGLFDRSTGTIHLLPNMPGAWPGYPVSAPVSAALGFPVALMNDARAFGLAELRMGAGRGSRTLIGLTLGTGVGGVVVIDGQVHLGADGAAGEIGHQTIDPDGPWCGCGNRGCLEAYARADQIAAACGTADPEAAVQAARGGDARALDGLSQVGRYLGIGIASLLNVLSPERVVLGGGVAAAGELLFAPIRDEIRRRVLNPSAPVPLVAAELGTWAGAIGAGLDGAARSGDEA